MSSPINGAQNEPPSIGIWPKIGPYVIPPIAASGAIIPAFKHMIYKSALQKGQPIVPISYMKGISEGCKAAPTVGAIVGSQMIIQNYVEKVIVGDKRKASLTDTFVSSGIVGIISSPILAIFNGQTMGLTLRESIRKFTLRQGVTIAGQETCFILGICASDRISTIMKSQFGDNKTVDYSGAYISGALGSIAGHPFNTALTRWQSGLTIDNPRQLMWGAARKAHAVGIFAVCYKLAKEKMK